MTAFESRDSCTPTALAMIMDESYDEVCARIRAAGGNYQAVTSRVAERVLKAKYTITRAVRFLGNQPPLLHWKKGRTGTWVLSTIEGNRGHCVCLKDGKMLDGWFFGHEKLKVQQGWQVQEAA